MRVYLFGFASDDFLGRVVVTPDERTVAQLAGQLVSTLDPTATLAEAGLGNGDIFKVERG
jgi:hypothetical protein